MPQILDLGEYGIHELPDDATPEEIQSFAQSLAERMTPPALTKLPTKPQSPQFTPGVPTLSITPEQIAANDEASRQMLDEVSVARMAGIHPNRVMSGKEMSDASGISPVITTPVSAVMKTGAGIANFLTSPRGVGESAVAATPAGPAVLTKWAYDMLHGAGMSLIDAKNAIKAKLDAMLVESMTQGGLGERARSDADEQNQRLAEDAVNTVAGGYFGAKLGKGVATDAIVKTAPQLMPKTALAREIEKAPLTGKLPVDEAARLRSQLQTKVEEVRQPEHQGTGEVGAPPEAVGSDSPASGGSAPKTEAELDAALQARGYGDIKRSKMTPEEKAAAAAEPIPTPEADAAAYWDMQDRLKAEKDPAKKMQLYQEFGLKSELIKNRNPKDSGNPPERPPSPPPPKRYENTGVGSPADEYGAVYGPKLSPEQVSKFSEQAGHEFDLESPAGTSAKLKVKPSMLWLEVSKKTGEFSEDVGVAYMKIRSDGTTVLDASHHKRPIDQIAADKLIEFLKQSSGEKQALENGYVKQGDKYIHKENKTADVTQGAVKVETPTVEPKTKVRQVPTPEKFDTFDDLLKFREQRLKEERDLYQEQIGLSADQARRLQDILTREGDTSRFEKTLTPEQQAKLNEFFDGPFNQKTGPFETWETDKGLDPSQVIKERDAGLLSSVLISAVEKGVEAKVNSDRFISAVIAARRMKELGITKSDFAKYLDRYTTRNSGSQGDKLEYFKSIGSKVESFLNSQKITLEAGDLSKTDLIAKLNALKVKGPTGENLHNVFSTKAIAEIGKQLWNDSIDVAIAAVKAGRSAKAAIAEAISHIKRNARNYDEANLRAGLEQILKDEGLDARVSRTPAVAEGAGSAPEVVSETASKSIESPEGQKPRKFSARATTSERIPEQVQEQIRTDERSSYTPQEVPVVRDTVKGMSDAELGAMTTDNAMFTEGKAELADRLFKAGNDQAGLDVIQNASVELTRLGQIINQAKLLNSIAPEAQILVIDEGLKKAGKDPLTEAQRGKVLELGRQGRVAKGELDKATEAWQKDPTPENAKKADEALDNKNKIDLELQKFTNAFQPKTYASLLKAILQGNLLTPISQTANIVGNLSFLPFRAATRSVTAGLDFLESAITGRPRTSTVGPISGTVEAAKGLARGAEKIPGILYRGTGNTILGEKRAGIQPIKAWMNQFAESPDMPTTGGKLTVNDRIKLLIEGTMGVAPEMMLRGLGAGDAPFKEAARGRVIANQLRLAKVPKAQWEMAQKFPELFFNKEKLDQIHKDTLAAVFQRESKTLSLLTHWIAGKGELFDLAVSTVAPYKVTPWNIIGEILSYNPVVAFSRGVYEAKQKNVRGINENAAKFLVGSALTGAGILLYKNGLLSPSLDSKDETMKERILSQQVMPPNHLNISGLKRMRSGGDPKFQPGDQTVDVFRSGGLAGAFFYMTANIGRSLEKSPQGDTTDLLGAIGSQSTLEQARFGLNQSFLSGVEGLLTSVKDGNTDNYVKQWASTVTSIPLPNTLSTLSRATRDFKPDFRADGFKGKIENIIRNRLGFAGLDDYLPLKRDFWGDPIPETPKDKSALFYQFFDVSKGQQITSDPKSIELYRLWRKTDDSKIIPTPVEKNQTFGDKTYILTPKQQEDLAIKVGELRKQAVDSLVVNPEWHKLTDEQKVSILQRAYNKGLEFGKGKFYVENKDALEAKPKKAGFITP